MANYKLSRPTKFLLIPLFVVFAFLALGIYSFLLLQNDETGLHEFNTGILQQRSRIVDFSFAVQDTITALYQMTATASTEANKAKLKNLQQEVYLSIDKLDTDYPAIQETMIKAGISENTAIKFSALMVDYSGASKNVINMVDTDAATAMAWMTPTNKKFADLEELLNGVSQELLAQKEARVSQLTADMEKGRDIFIAIILAVSLLTIFLSFVIGKFMSALDTLHASTNTMLESLGQGLLFFDEQGICSPIYSKSCLDMLECDPAHKHIADVFKLNTEDRGLFQSVLEMLFKGKMAMGFQELAALAPKTYTHSGGLNISLTYRPILGTDGALKNVLLVATDRTKEKYAEKKLKEIEVAALRTIRIARSRNYFMHFVRSFESCIMTKKCATNQESIDQIRRDVHTIKGMATMFQFVELAHALHRLEVSMPYDMTDPETILAPHREKLARLFEDGKAYAREILGDSYQSSGKIRSIPEQRLYAFVNRLQHNFTGGASMQELCKAFCNDVLSVPIWQLLEDFIVCLQEISDRLGKSLNPCIFSGENFLILPEIYERLFASFVHIARNMLDHGIESTDVRNQRGKNPKATITIRTEIFRREANDWLLIEFQDDGGGIDVAQLRKNIMEKIHNINLDRLDDHSVIQHLFDAKISTRKHVTHISGRGIGLNSVKAEVDKLGGTIAIFSEPGLGVKLRIELPYLQTLPPKMTKIKTAS